MKGNISPDGSSRRWLSSFDAAGKMRGSARRKGTDLDKKKDGENETEHDGIQSFGMFLRELSVMVGTVPKI
jgi:hypothetical protein